MLFWNRKPKDEFKGVQFKISAKELPHTPDVTTLQQKESHLYFAYHLLNNSHPGYLEPAVTADPFQLWKGRHGTAVSPVATHAIPELRRVPCLPIKGRLILLSTQELIQLDEWTQNGVQFTRKRIEVRIPRVVENTEYDRMKDRDIFPAECRRGGIVKFHTGGTVKAHVHLGREDYFLPKLDGGFDFAPVKPFDPLFPKYLQFTVKDFDG